jgi:hypothetical protein
MAHTASLERTPGTNQPLNPSTNFRKQTGDYHMYKSKAYSAASATSPLAHTISTGIIITPLANDELKGPRGPGYRRMIELSAAGRAGTQDEVGTVGALLMGPDGAFITGSDFLMDGGVTAAYWFGELAPK